ncbi:MAG: aspartate aminotransferase family protein [SAR324 cluster bacterium]|uniref:Aspartate aminotransferase family protein n=1 Tax=SAR324 cluster bacterium TaxID=2024889 RepID=A0A2D6YKX3_9DELT|nr:aspartate aminotransferase family protein [SAR324 cluster bacterium]
MLRSTNEWQSLDSRHFMHPFTDSKDLGRNGTRIITKAEGVYLWDSEGNQIIDGMAGLWCVNVGYGREELAKAAYKQLQQLPYYNSFFQCTHPPAIELSEKLAQISPTQFNHVFYVNSGSEANDTVLRMVRNYWKLLGQPQKRVLISRINGYHGSTVAGASLGGQKFIHDIDDLPIPDIVHIDQPYWYQNGGDSSPSEYGILAAQELEKKINELGIESVAAFIGEPIQGAGGVIVPPETYWPEIQRICDKYEILLIADEVICGFGRTGHWFGSEYFNIRPDLMPIAKGLSSGYLPIGGVMIADRIADVIIGKGKEFAHGFTYSGHPAACVVASRNLEIIKREGLVEKVRNETGPYLRKLLEQFNEHPLVGEVRNAGLLGAIELVNDKSSRSFFPERGKVGERCRDLCIRNGLVMRAVKDTMILSPPLVASRDHLDEIYKKALKSLNQLAEELGRC